MHALDHGFATERGTVRPHLQLTASVETVMGLRAGCPRPPPGRRCGCATGAASGRGASAPRPGPPPTTCFIGARAGAPRSPTSCIVNTTPRGPPREISVGHGSRQDLKGVG
jgi:hypothetical protein